MTSRLPFLFRLLPGMRLQLLFLLPLLCVCGVALAGDASSATNHFQIGTNVTDVGASALRLIGGLALVMALLFGGAILFRNWQGIQLQGVRQSHLRVLEAKSLGGRHALYVVGYQQQRLLVSSSPSGVTLLSHLPAAEPGEPEPAAAARPHFIDALQQVLRKKS